MNDNESVRGHFDAIGQTYDIWKRKNSYYYAQLKCFYREHIPAGSSVCEFGTATGDILSSVEPRRGLGIDLSRNLIEIARKKYPAYEFAVCDAAHFSSPERFDYIIMSDLLDHVVDIPAAIRNAHAHLTGQGKLVCTTINPLWNPLMDVLEKLRLKMPEGPHSFIPNRFIALFCQISGFTIIEQKPLIFFPKRIPLVSSFLNTVMPAIPLINRFCWVQVLVAQKHNALPRRLSYSVVIPAYNEAHNIQECIERLPQTGREYEIIVVDDGSKDGTAAVLEKLLLTQSRLRVVRCAQNRGKALAVEEGLAASTKEIVLILDADMAVAPEDVPLFLEPLERGLARFTNGTRLVYGMEKNAMSEIKRIGNFMFALFLSSIIRFRLTDTLCGTKAFFRADFEGVRFCGEQWGDFVLLAHAGRKGLPIVEIPVRYHSRKAGESKMSVLRDGFRFMYFILRTALNNCSRWCPCTHA